MTDESKFPSTPLFIHKFLLLSDLPFQQNQDSCYFFASHEFDSTNSSIFQLNGELTESRRGDICSAISSLLIMNDDDAADDDERKGGGEEEGHIREK